MTLLIQPLLAKQMLIKREVVPNKAVAVSLFVFTSIAAGIFRRLGLLGVLAYMQGVEILLSAKSDSQVPPVAETVISSATIPEVVVVENTTREKVFSIILGFVIVNTIFAMGVILLDFFL